MIFMLDTDTCSYIIKKHPLQVLRTMQNKVEQGQEICISSISYAELLLGAERSANQEKHLTLIQEFCSRLDDIKAWDQYAAKYFSVLQANLFKQGKPIGSNDTMIAAHALSLGATVVTNNSRHFSRVNDLPLENWVK